ncbi:site-specific DNA-methyltransferase [Acidovorax sp. M2(2025)]|uniref:site-specific DNA-methyltransferase n=1 Tax=Acidovorax sp. M2(2025) TaxID=3411355 RepID=UPI003BF61E9C
MSQQKQRFVELLEELFQLNQPELDFGLYRILHARSQEIRAFMSGELATEIDQAFAGQAVQSAHELLQAAKQKVLDDLADDAFDAAGELKPEYLNTKIGKDYLQAQQAAREGSGPLSDQAQVYDHLYRFFSRYYDKGDFMSKRYFVAENDQRAAPYAVPYDGREVMLHWANKDQYYIKSSEHLSNYSFDLTEALRLEAQRQGKGQELDFGGEAGLEPMKVHFRLAAATEGEHNNVKESQDRFFLIHAAEPIKFEAGSQGQIELVVQFEYRPDPDKTGQTNTWQQQKLAEAAQAVLQALQTAASGDGKSQAYARGLAHPSPTEKRPDRTVLAKYMAQFADRNTMDYFIHKDLGGFLRRELDFYIKNEVMRLDDIEAASAPRVESYLGKLRVLRRIARRIINFLSQIEDFQKKLWLKKKFVFDSQYCITLDRVPVALYEKIANNSAQIAEWIELYAIDQVTGDLTKASFTAPPTVEFLQQNQYLLVDTGLFDDAFKDELVSCIDDLDLNLDGLLINSDNLQALNTTKNLYEESFDAAYIDPPYNTDAGPIDYKNGYRSSSWITMMNDRLEALRPLLKAEAAVCITIDDYQVHELANLLDNSFGKDLHLGTSIIRNNPSGRSTVKGLSICHEYAFFYGASESAELARLPRTEKQLERFTVEEGAHVDWRNFRKDGGSVTHRAARPKQFYPLFVNPEENKIRIPEMEWDEANRSWKILELPSEGETALLPVDEKGRDRVWSLNHISAIASMDDLKIKYSPKSGLQVLRRHTPSEGVLPRSWWDKNTYAAREYGSATLTQLFGEASFSFAKSPFAVQDCLWVCGLSEDSNGKVIDYFGGSGTTAHAAINLNRQDEGKRKYVLVEQGAYFDSVLKPRIKKAIYSAEWKNGKPIDRKGISHAFKYLRLESFEDTLNNMAAFSTECSPVLSQHTSADFKREYILKYLLNFETTGNPSLLNEHLFADPTAYKILIKQPGTDVQALRTIDLVETFNIFIGLHVTLLDKPRTYSIQMCKEADPELPGDQDTRWVNKGIDEVDSGDYWFRMVEGDVFTVPGDELSRERVLVIWRKLTGDPGRDQAALEAWLNKMKINPRDTDFATIYVNGSHALNTDGSAGARVCMIEETFAQRMWEDV